MFASIETLLPRGDLLLPHSVAMQIHARSMDP